MRTCSTYDVLPMQSKYVGPHTGTRVRTVRAYTSTLTRGD